jgi:hypothetical protein
VALATVVVLAAVAVALPGGAGGARAADRVALVCVGLLIAAGLSVLAAPYVRADGPGVTVRNLTRRRQLEWAEIVSLRLRRGDPWLMIDLTDGTTLAAMGIQSADGARGRGAAAELASVVRGHQPWLREPSSGPHPR